MIPPLAIVQARRDSTRLHGKMLLPLAGRPLLLHAVEAAVQAFGAEHVVCAIPAGARNAVLGTLMMDRGISVCVHEGPEHDVLGRFHACAHRHRWHPHSVIVRVTPDDPFKVPLAMRAVAIEGRRLPVEIGAEAFTLNQLDAAHYVVAEGRREHLTPIFFPGSPPPKPPDDQIWTVDTPEDYARACVRAEGLQRARASLRRVLPPTIGKNG